MQEIRRGWPAVREAFTEGRTPLTSLNHRVGWDRRLVLIRGRLDVVKRVAHAQGGTVSDVLLTTVAAGLRGLLHSRGNTSRVRATPAMGSADSRCTMSSPAKRAETWTVP